MPRIGIDVGGTFTDVVAVDAAGRVTFIKVPTTPADQSVRTVGARDALGLGSRICSGAPSASCTA